MREWIEQHPYLTGGIILGAIVLFIILRNRSASASAQVVSAGPSDALQAAELQAGVQLQTAQLGAQSQIAQVNAAVNATQLQQAAQVQQTQIAAGVQNYQTAGQVQLGLASLGFTPSNSPFGATLPIVGAPTQPVTMPVVSVGQQTMIPAVAAQAAQENSIIAAAASTPGTTGNIPTVPAPSSPTTPYGIPFPALSYSLEQCQPLDVACTQRNLASETAGVTQHIQDVNAFNSQVAAANAAANAGVGAAAFPGIQQVGPHQYGYETGTSENPTGSIAPG